MAWWQSTATQWWLWLKFQHQKWKWLQWKSQRPSAQKKSVYFFSIFLPKWVVDIFKFCFKIHWFQFQDRRLIVVHEFGQVNWLSICNSIWSKRPAWPRISYVKSHTRSLKHNQPNKETQTTIRSKFIRITQKIELIASEGKQHSRSVGVLLNHKFCFRFFFS